VKYWFACAFELSKTMFHSESDQLTFSKVCSFIALFDAYNHMGQRNVLTCYESYHKIK